MSVSLLLEPTWLAPGFCFRTTLYTSHAIISQRFGIIISQLEALCCILGQSPQLDSSGVMPRVSQGSRWPRNQLSAFLCHGASKWDCWGCQCLTAMRCCSGSSRIRTWSQLSYGSTTWNGKQIELNDDRQLKKTNSSTEENDPNLRLFYIFYCRKHSASFGYFQETPSLKQWLERLAMAGDTRTSWSADAKVLSERISEELWLPCESFPATCIFPMVLSRRSCIEKAFEACGEEKASSCQLFEGIQYIPGKLSAGIDYNNYYILLNGLDIQLQVRRVK